MSGINKLTDRQIKNLKPGARRIKIGDGDKLWLFVSPSGIKVWRMLWKEGNTQKQLRVLHKECYNGILQLRSSLCNTVQNVRQSGL